jgi:lipopolysaccharide/colanic/teichoic acid biosynthesis glycosyltransferase
MRKFADKEGTLTIGERDPRVTFVGYHLRRYKLDELPQLINVLLGNMSMVGPRPDVRKYVDYYPKQYLRVLAVKPGITDYASLEYIEENKLLVESNDPHTKYINEIVPKKLELNLQYVENRSLKEYFKIISYTIKAIMNIKSFKNK